MKPFSLFSFAHIWVPIIFFAGQIALEILTPQHLKPAMHSEWGPHETLQTIVITSAFLVAVFTLPKINWRGNGLVGAWLALAAICSFYVAGEEISWGQHILDWPTPETWSRINDQNETNLHNTSSWLDQKPRLVLFIGITVGGLIVPALRRWKPSLLPQKFSPLYPSNYLIVTALGVLLPYLAEEIAEHFITGDRLFHRVSELQELYMYYFILLYLIELRGRNISRKI
jgi:hypothetical protein